MTRKADEQYTINPNTGRRILVGGKTYRKAFKSGLTMFGGAYTCSRCGGITTQLFTCDYCEAEFDEPHLECGMICHGCGNQNKPCIFPEYK